MKNKKNQQHNYVADFQLVNRLGFEPKTHSLEGCCSIQLSYRSILTIMNAEIHVCLKTDANLRFIF